MPLLLSSLYGYNATHISLLTIGRPLTWGLAGPLSAWLVMRGGNRRVVLAGVLCNIAACLLLTRIGGGSSQIEIALMLAFAGFGVGIIVAPLMAMLTRAVSRADLGVAAATSGMMVQIGSAAGVQLMQTVQVSRAAHTSVLASYHSAFVVAAIVSSVSVVTALAIRREGR